MTAYILTPAQHSQLVDALWTVIQHNKLHHGVANNTVSQCESALAMLKAMKPTHPTAWVVDGGKKNGMLLPVYAYEMELAVPKIMCRPLYAMETKT